MSIPIAPTITVPTGRRIAADVTGPDDAPVVVLCHVAPGSRRFDPDPAASASAGIRLITIDRAGYGRSEPLAENEVPTITGHADDAITVLDSLGVRDAVLVGWSAGGRVAAAIAARRPELARALFVVATPAPDDAVPWVPDDQRPALAAMRANPLASLRPVASMLADAVPAPTGAMWMLSAGDADAAALENAEIRTAVEAMLAEAFAQGTIGLAADLIAYTAVPWGFNPSSIRTSTCCVYGEDDGLVAPAHGRWWSEQIAGSELLRVPGAGHLVIREIWPLVVATAMAATRGAAA